MNYLIRMSSKAFEELDFLGYIYIYHIVRNEIPQFRSVEYIFNGSPSEEQTTIIQNNEKEKEKKGGA
jgi:hypothetical protein